MEIYFAKVLEWLEILKKEQKLEENRIGIYFKNNYLHHTNEKSEDCLTAGPSIGEDLDHLSVQEQYEYLKKECNTKIIQLKNDEGSIFAELLISTNKSEAIQYNQAVSFKTFPQVKDYLPFKARSLESSRLILKNFTDKDAAGVFEFASNPNVAQFMAWKPHKNIEESLRMIKRANANYEKGVAFPLGITLKDDPEQKVIGMIGLTLVSARHRTFELVYALGEKYWGKGILQEAAKVLIDFSFDHFAMNRLQCSCKVENSQSARVMEKLGMKYEGVLRNYIYVKEEYWDLKMYSLLKDEHRG